MIFSVASESWPRPANSAMMHVLVKHQRPDHRRSERLKHGTRIVERTRPHPPKRNHDLPWHGSRQEGSHHHEEHILPEDQPQEDRGQEQIKAETKAIFIIRHERHAELLA